jgi:hypothetical protein
VHKCKLCKTAWLLGKRVLIGICTNCGKIAMRRNDLQIAARAVACVESAGWSGDWPGILTVRFLPEWGRTLECQLSYEEADQAWDLPTLLAVQRRALAENPDREK